MTHRLDVARGRDIITRWCNLAERRLEYLTELFETGRWRRYHSERAFLENIQEAKAAVETWRDLLRCEASRENLEIDVSWLGRTKVTPLPRGDGLIRRVREPSPRPAPVSSEISQSALAAVSQAIGVSSHEAPPTLSIDAPALEPDLLPVAEPVQDGSQNNSLKLAINALGVHNRYPLLRNVL